MTYSLKFHPAAQKEWNKLGKTVQKQFKTKLKERLETPRVPASKLSGHEDRYKINSRRPDIASCIKSMTTAFQWS